MKKIFWFLFAAFATISALCADLRHVTAPILFGESAVSDSQQADVVAVSRPAPLKPAQMPVAQSRPAGDEATVPVTVDPTAAAPAEIEDASPVTKANALIANEIISGVPTVVRPDVESATIWVSEWIDIPAAAVEGRNSGTVAQQRTAIENGLSKVSSAVAQRVLFPMPLAPELAQRQVGVDANITATASKDDFAKPAARPMQPIEDGFSQVSSAIAQRFLFPIPAEPVTHEAFAAGSESVAINKTSSAATAVETAKPAVRTLLMIENGISQVSSAITQHVLFPIPASAVAETKVASLEQPAPAQTAIKPLQSIENGFSQVSKAITQRVLFPMPSAPAEVGHSVSTDIEVNSDTAAAVSPRNSERTAATDRSLNVIENGFAQVSSAIAQRVLFPTPTAPIIEAPVPPTTERVTLNENAMAITTNTEIVKTPVKYWPVIEDGFAQVSSAVAQRVLFAAPQPPVIEEAVVAPIKEQVSEPVAAMQTTSLMVDVAGGSLTNNLVASRNDEMTNAALALTAARPIPALISKQTLYSPSMLAPFDFGTKPIDSVFSGLLASYSNNGPSAEASNFSDVDNRMAMKRDPPNAAAPVLINAQSGFSIDMLKPMGRNTAVPANLSQVLSSSSEVSTAAIPDGSYCDPNFVGPPIRFSQTVELRLDDLLSQLNARFGINFVIGPEIAKLPLNVKAGSIPWNVLLKSQLYVSGVRATCIDRNTIELVRTDKVADLEKARTDAEVLQSKYIKLKYLQPSSGGNKNIAGQSSGGSSSGSSGGGQSSDCQQQGGQGGGQGGGQQILPQRCKFERLMTEIRQIIGINSQTTGGGVASVNGGSGQQNATLENAKKPYVGQVPGRNMLLVNASIAQLRDIDELIRRADVPPFQVVIKALVYTANENKLKDIGAQASAIFGTGDLSKLGGITSQLPATPTGTGATNPGGVRTLGPGFPLPSGSGDSVFGLSAIVGTAQF
ncbi:MAG: hypothetical protein ABJB40_04085, partial [Acidobacteriota bacterium]